MTYLRFSALLLLLVAVPALAANTVIEPTAGEVNGAIEIPIYIDTGSEITNVVEGRIAIPEGFVVDAVRTAGSDLSLYTVAPAYVPGERAIIFTGGTPGTVEGRTYLFTIRGHAEAAGTYTLHPTEFFLYRADGKGSRVTISTEDATIDVGGTSAAPKHQSTPTTATPLIADSGSDGSLFDGKRFVTFFGGDQGKGVDYYLVQEGIWSRGVKADRYYVLKDQTGGTSVFVTAVNKDGRIAVTTIPGSQPWREYLPLLIVALLIGGIGFVKRRRP